MGGKYYLAPGLLRRATPVMQDRDILHVTGHKDGKPLKCYINKTHTDSVHQKVR